MTDKAASLWLLFEKCARVAEREEWSQWRGTDYVTDLGEAAGTASVVAAEVVPRPTPGMPGLGFSHMTLLRFDAAPSSTPAAVIADLRRDGRLHGAHTVLDAQVFATHGLHAAASRPDPGLTGHILAYVTANDPEDLDEWDRWYDQDHLPDMLATGAFAAGSRWRRDPPQPIGANDITLYDVTSARVEDAVDTSAAAMPALIAAGRKRSTHVGGLTVVLHVESATA